MKNKKTVFDLESRNWTEFLIAGIFDGEEYTVVYSAESLLNFLTQKKFKSYKHYSHFGGKFDIRFLLPEMVKQDLYFEIIEQGGRITYLKLKKDDMIFHFVDSFNLLPQGLKKLGQAFNVTHQKKEIDVEKFDLNSAEHLSYLKYDCVCLFECLEKFESWGFNADKKTSLTLASQAMKIYNKDIKKLTMTKANTDEEKFFRNCYLGGRVEIFNRLGKNLNYYDFNSLYPSVMLEYLPYGNIIQTNKFESKHLGFYEIEVFNYETKNGIGYIPKIHDGKMLFPFGNFSTFVSDLEIRRLRKDKIKFKILNGYYFDSKAKYFEHYILYLYNERLKAKENKDTAIDLIAKLLMNSLYGKFGEKREKEKIIRCSSDEAFKKQYEPYDLELGLYICKEQSKSQNIFVYISAYITALAREKLYCEIEKNSADEIFYCDTDSVITSKNLNHSEKLGELKLEHKIKKACFVAPKVYCFIDDKGKEHLKCKGIRKPNFNYSHFERMTKTGESITEHFEKNTGLRENINRFDGMELTRVKTKKQISGKYTKRKIIENRTKAIYFKKDVAIDF